MGFWDSRPGLRAAADYRRSATVYTSMQLEVPTKKTRAGTRRRAAEALQGDFAANPTYTHSPERWPPPRANVALEIDVGRSVADGARIDSVCKWLLDCLNGVAYADDRQVKLLFARISRPREMDFGDDSWGHVAPQRINADPSLRITTRLHRHVMADLRALKHLERRWDPFDEGEDTYGWVERIQDDESLVEYASWLDPTDPHDAKELGRVRSELDYLSQARQQRLVDMICSSLFTELPIGRAHFWTLVRTQVSTSPYFFDLGTLPARGGSAGFQQRVRDIFEARRQRHPHLLPLRATSGLSLILFEGTGADGKDLDNLVRSILPLVLEVLRPPRDDLRGWIADEAEPGEAVTDVPFIEIAALPADGADVEPGTLLLGLSSASRYSSWWELAADHLDRALSDDRWDD